jgi:multidrug efflux pump subunit AcrB
MTATHPATVREPKTAMRMIDTAVKNPAAVAVAVFLVLLFGALSLTRLPLQLFPDIDRPQMSVQAGWRAASPVEVEAELMEPIEAVLQGIPGLQEMDGNANGGGAFLNLTFALGTDMQGALVEVLGRLNRLPPLPADADPPVVQMQGQDANQTLSWFFVQQLPGTAGEIADQRRFVEDVVKPRIESVPGVAGVQVNGGPPEQLAITLDPSRAAALGIQVPQLVGLIGRATDVSGGTVDAGRRQYTLRLAGRYQPDQLRELILLWRDGAPVRLGDVAQVAIQRPERQFLAYQNGNPAIGLRVDRESGANVVATLDQVRAEVERLRTGVLAERGLGIEQSFDPSLFINRAIGLLSGNLVAGILLAVLCIWWFLRNARATVLIASAIPICLAATFIVLALTGRTLNVISLAGLAFAVGMVMDAAVVVAENILRLRDAGMAPMRAAVQGTRQVGSAILASTLTTIAVFLPVMFLADVEGQLFADLALTVAIAVAISMLVAIFVLPAAAGGWLRSNPSAAGAGPTWPALTARLLRASDSQGKRVGWILGLTVLPLLLGWALLPRIDYLPPVKRAAIDAYFQFPPGMSAELIDREIVAELNARMMPYMRGEREPQLSNFYILVWPGGGTLGARVVDQSQIGALERIVRDEVVAGLPDTRAFVSEGNLFGGFGGSNRAIAMNVQHGDTATLKLAAERGQALLEQAFPGAQVQAFPSADAVQPELRLSADDRRLAEAGWTRSDLGTVVRALGQGVWLGEHFDGDQRMDIILRGQTQLPPERLAEVPLATPLAGVVPLGELASVQTTLSPSQLRRVDRRRTVTLTIDPPASMSLEEALARVDAEVLPALRAELPGDAAVRLSGSADRLDGMVASLGGNFLMALLVLFALMTALFKSVRDAGFVMLAMPVALLGGVLGLRALGLVGFQTLDLLSMIGFIMLLGMVINNAILLVMQTRVGEAEGLGRDAAVEQALQQRLRPILIGALTGVLGALPMAVNPGPGAIIYRGLAAVTVGGVLLNLLFIAVLVPSLLRLRGMRARVRMPAAQPAPLAVAALALPER